MRREEERRYMKTDEETGRRRDMNTFEETGWKKAHEDFRGDRK